MPTNMPNMPNHTNMPNQTVNLDYSQENKNLRYMDIQTTIFHYSSQDVKNFIIIIIIIIIIFKRDWTYLALRE